MGYCFITSKSVNGISCLKIDDRIYNHNRCFIDLYSDSVVYLLVLII